jgi:hypothetical protein
MWLKKRQQSMGSRVDLSQIPDRFYVLALGYSVSCGVILNITAVVMANWMDQFLSTYIAGVGFLLSFFSFHVVLFGAFSRVLLLQKGIPLQGRFFSKVLEPKSLNRGILLGVALIILTLALYCVHSGTREFLLENKRISSSILFSVTYGLIGFELIVFCILLRVLTIDLPVNGSSSTSNGSS